MTPAHAPVLLSETVALLQPSRGGTFVDCTLGLGGHAAALLEAGAGRVIGLDRDPRALELAGERLSHWGDRVVLVHADYRDLPAVLAERGIGAVDGALADLGVSSMQLDEPARGFSFRADGPLDMRMDPTRGETAASMLAVVDEQELADVIYRFGEERKSRRVARAIVEARREAPIETTARLASIVRRAAGGGTYQRIDPATRTFQALRIWVNRELDGLDTFIADAARALCAGGRLVVIAFHSLEDRIVKHTMRMLAKGEGLIRGEGLVRVLTKKPVTATDGEVAGNPRARSAKLRAVERVA
ncbi:MAG TPA: 16S rRNA (cytosine(1402)-N(4))-methyltransferase RsmH [Vicinamibacterales bacterium]|nr:16S rRNA (cytosine(1402)-N(4))-methyltransferase RsmH [Vicinamibacterales bacterium]